MDRRISEEQPDNWSDLIALGLGVSRAILGEEPRRNPRPWVRGCEPELSSFDQEVSRASLRKRKAEDWDEWKAFVADVRRCKRRRFAWLRSKEVAWWDQKAQQVQDKADQGDDFGVFAIFKELRHASLSLGEVRPADALFERDAWAEHFRLRLGRTQGWLRIGFGQMYLLFLRWMLCGEMPRPLMNFMQLFARCR